METFPQGNDEGEKTRDKIAKENMSKGGKGVKVEQEKSTFVQMNKP